MKRLLLLIPGILLALSACTQGQGDPPQGGVITCPPDQHNVRIILDGKAAEAADVHACPPDAYGWVKLESNPQLPVIVKISGNTATTLGWKGSS